jgi:AraC-like DNA-binding protein
MKPVIHHLPLQPYNSVVSAFCTPHIETGWHQHNAYELNLLTQGSGYAFIGKYAGNFEPGDIFFLGTNVPHMFQNDRNTENSSVIIHFNECCLGNRFFELPECWQIKELLETSACGLKITGNTRSKLQPLIQSFETSVDGNLIILLLQCLHLMASEREYVSLSSGEKQKFNHSGDDCIDLIFKYTIDTFHEPVSLSQVAGIACKSVPSFCHYFKLRTQKTYIHYLNEVRISYACHQLLRTKKSVADICYESGFNTVTNFHRQFLRFKRVTPMQYRKLKRNK